eukprot:1272320-Rhodomonas_salina.1
MQSGLISLRARRTGGAINLRACYPMSGTEPAYGTAIGLRTRYEMSGTERAYGATRRRGVRFRTSRGFSTLSSGTNAYLPTRPIRHVRYCHSVWCYRRMRYPILA